MRNNQNSKETDYRCNVRNIFMKKVFETFKNQYKSFFRIGKLHQCLLL